MRFVLVALILVARVAAADTDLDLAYHPLPVEDRVRLHESARTVRITGIALTVAGIVAAIAQEAAPFTGSTRDFGLQTASLIGSQAILGTGASMWALGDFEGRRIDGHAKGRAHGISLMANGIILLALGAGATAGSIALTNSARCSSQCGPEGVPAAIGGLALGSVATLLTSVGSPILAIGVGEQRHGAALFVDSIGPRVMPQGAGIGASGRF